jgi:hypothetical protein
MTVSQESERDTVLATFHALLDGMANRDRAAVLATMIPEAAASHSRGDTITHTALRALVDRLPSGPATLEERLVRTTVLVDTNIAVI